MISRWILLKMRNVWDISRRENQIHSFRFNKSPPTKSCGLWGNVEKYGTARQDTDGNTPRALRMLDSLGYKTLWIFDTYCFPTGTVVPRTRLGVTFMRTFPVLLAYFLRLSFCSSSSQEANMWNISTLTMTLSPSGTETRSLQQFSQFTYLLKFGGILVVIIIIIIMPWQTCFYFV